MAFFLVPGESLGKDNSGRVEPVPIAEVKTNRAGIGRGECEGANQRSSTSTEVSSFGCYILKSELYTYMHSV